MGQGNSIQDTALGDHDLYFYNAPQDRRVALFSNLRVGLDQGCSALYIAGGEALEGARVEAEGLGLDLDESEGLRVVSAQSLYTPDGTFNGSRVVKRFKGLVDESVERGFNGLYVSADVADLFDRLAGSQDLTSWLSYENSLGRKLGFPMEALCAYRVDQVVSNGHALLHLLRAHRRTLTSETMAMVDNEKTVMDAITEALRNIMGETAASIIFDYLETTFMLPPSQIPDEIEPFNRTMEAICGRKAAHLIKLRIIKRLHGKIEFPKRSWKQFLATQR